VLGLGAFKKFYKKNEIKKMLLHYSCMCPFLYCIHLVK